MRWLRWAFPLLAIPLTAVLAVKAVHADPLPAAPSLTIEATVGVENVVEIGDVLVFYRYTLPEVNWASYTVDGAIAVLDQGDTIYQVRVPPTVGEGFGAFYLSPGSGFVFGDPAVVTLESNPALFATNTSDAFALDGSQYLATNSLVIDSPDDQTSVCKVVLSMLTAVEQADSTDAITTGYYVNGGTATVNGTLAAIAAFNAFPEVLPNCFAQGLTYGMGAYDPVGPQLRTNLTNTQEASTFWTSFSALSVKWGFRDPAIFAALVGLALASIIWAVFLGFGTPMVGTGISGEFLLGWALIAPQIWLQIFFVATLLMLVMSTAFVARRLPT